MEVEIIAGIIICIFIGLFMFWVCFPMHHFERNESRDENY
jgi:hypothetical protein